MSNIGHCVCLKSTKILAAKLLYLLDPHHSHHRRYSIPKEFSVYGPTSAATFVADCQHRADRMVKNDWFNTGKKMEALAFWWMPRFADNVVLSDAEKRAVEAALIPHLARDNIALFVWHTPLPPSRNAGRQKGPDFNMVISSVAGRGALLHPVRHNEQSIWGEMGDALNAVVAKLNILRRGKPGLTPIRTMAQAKVARRFKSGRLKLNQELAPFPECMESDKKLLEVLRKLGYEALSASSGKAYRIRRIYRPCLDTPPGARPQGFYRNGYLFALPKLRAEVAEEIERRKRAKETQVGAENSKPALERSRTKPSTPHPRQPRSETRLPHSTQTSGEHETRPSKPFQTASPAKQPAQPSTTPATTESRKTEPQQTSQNPATPNQATLAHHGADTGRPALTKPAQPAKSAAGQKSTTEHTSPKQTPSALDATPAANRISTNERPLLQEQSSAKPQVPSSQSKAARRGAADTPSDATKQTHPLKPITSGAAKTEAAKGITLSPKQVNDPSGQPVLANGPVEQWVSSKAEELADSHAADAASASKNKSSSEGTRLAEPRGKPVSTPGTASPSPRPTVGIPTEPQPESQGERTGPSQLPRTPLQEQPVTSAPQPTSSVKPISTDRARIPSVTQGSGKGKAAGQPVTIEKAWDILTKNAASRPPFTGGLSGAAEHVRSLGHQWVGENREKNLLSLEIQGQEVPLALGKTLLLMQWASIRQRLQPTGQKPTVPLDLRNLPIKPSEWETDKKEVWNLDPCDESWHELWVTMGDRQNLEVWHHALETTASLSSQPLTRAEEVVKLLREAGFAATDALHLVLAHLHENTNLLFQLVPRLNYIAQKTLPVKRTGDQTPAVVTARGELIPSRPSPISRTVGTPNVGDSPPAPAKNRLIIPTSSKPSTRQQQSKTTERGGPKLPTQPQPPIPEASRPTDRKRRRLSRQEALQMLIDGLKPEFPPMIDRSELRRLINTQGFSMLNSKDTDEELNIDIAGTIVTLPRLETILVLQLAMIRKQLSQDPRAGRFPSPNFASASDNPVSALSLQLQLSLLGVLSPRWRELWKNMKNEKTRDAWYTALESLGNQKQWTIAAAGELTKGLLDHGLNARVASDLVIAHLHTDLGALKAVSEQLAGICTQHALEKSGAFLKHQQAPATPAKPKR